MVVRIRCKALASSSRRLLARPPDGSIPSLYGAAEYARATVRASDRQTLQDRTRTISPLVARRVRALKSSEPFSRDRPTPDVPWLSPCTFSESSSDNRYSIRRTYIDDAEKSVKLRKESWSSLSARDPSEGEETQRRLLALYEQYFADVAEFYDHKRSLALTAHSSCKRVEMAWLQVLKEKDASVAQEKFLRLRDRIEAGRERHLRRASEEKEGASEKSSDDAEGEGVAADVDASSSGPSQEVATTGEREKPSFHVVEESTTYPFLRRFAASRPDAVDHEVLSAVRGSKMQRPQQQSMGEGDFPPGPGQPETQEPRATPDGPSPAPAPSAGRATVAGENSEKIRKPGPGIFRRLDSVVKDLFPTWDAEGMFYNSQRPQDSGSSALKTRYARTIRPKKVRASLNPAKRGVVKVPWSVAGKLGEQPGDPRAQRAREFLVRTVRGEEPTIF